MRSYKVVRVEAALRQSAGRLFIVVVSIVPIIAPFGTFMARLTDINQRRNTIIQGLVIMAMAIEVIDSVSDWGSFASQSRERLQSCAAA